MAGWTGLGAGVKALVLGSGAAAAVVVAAVVWQARVVPLPAPDVPAPEQVAAAPAAAPEAAPTAPAPGPDEPAALRPDPPSFDVVRVEPDGATLVAGRAWAGQEVAVLVDGAEAAVAQADPQGRFVVFLTLAASSSARIMTLELRPAGSAAVPSDDQVVLAPSAAAVPEPEGVAKAPAAATEPEPPVDAVQVRPEVPDGTAALSAEPATEVAAAPAVDPAPASGVAAAPAPTEASAAQPVPKAVATVLPSVDPAADAIPAPEKAEPQAVVAAAEPAPEPGQVASDPAIVATAPTALLVSGNTARVLQSADAKAAAPPGTVSIDTISYTAGGEVALSGRGAARAFVRLYLDNRVLLETAIAEDGTWGGTLPAVVPGVYTLRADQVSAAGQVTSRYETPFQREDPVALATTAPAAEGQAGTTPQAAITPGRVSITVQPGFTLWQIARDNYGDGTLYVRVYDANKTLIRDPDLIYPGQVFSVPSGN